MSDLSPPQVPATAPGGYQSVLVVDDSVVQRQHAVRLCRELGIELVDKPGGVTVWLRR